MNVTILNTNNSYSLGDFLITLDESGCLKVINHTNDKEIFFGANSGNSVTLYSLTKDAFNGINFFEVLNSKNEVTKKFLFKEFKDFVKSYRINPVDEIFKASNAVKIDLTKRDDTFKNNTVLNLLIQKFGKKEGEKKYKNIILKTGESEKDILKVIEDIIPNPEDRTLIFDALKSL